MTTRLVLLRHGETINGFDDRAVLSGRTDLPLTSLGREQARALARAAAVREATRIYTSPLQRARDTARYLADELRYELVECAGLQEIDCGQLDGVEIELLRARFPDVWVASQSQTDDAFRWPGGESYAELRARSVRTVTEIARRERGARVLVVTHAGVITQLLGHLTGRSPACWSAYRAGNASITEVDWDDGAGALVSFDHREHLPATLQT